MLRTRGIVVIVDGYNVSMRGWGDAATTDQRERLISALEALHLRLRCDTVAVFDGSDVAARPNRRRRRGVRVVFSAADEEADPVIVREVEALPAGTPVVVASSDRWVRDHTEHRGAAVVSAETLLGLLRR
jgi:predicted RNA-binding protein with PIN domain